jgi:hypothetical protein
MFDPQMPADAVEESELGEGWRRGSEHGKEEPGNYG